MRINITQFKKELDKPLREMGGIAINAARAKFVPIKKDLMKKFNEHGVTQELEAGAVTGGSKFLDRGNLYSFFGFIFGREPVAPLREKLEKEVDLDDKVSIDKKETSITYSYEVKIPEESELESITPLDWEGGSWLKAVEEGLSNFSHYAYHRFFNPEISRSSTGTQGKNNRGGSFGGTPYLRELLNNFRNKLDK